MSHHVSRVHALLLGASCAAIAGAPALAQDDGGAPEARSVDRIVVTAQQREQSQQDVPISIGAYDETLIENAGVRDIKDLINISPGLMVTSTQSETITTARIRGIGTVGDNFGLESSVGVYIDGVFRARNGVSFGDLGEIERIEVLRGPQGTLFGKNTSAGVINIITKAPEAEFGGSAEVSYGNFNAVRAAATLTGPIAEDTAAFRIFAATGNRDGYQDITIGKGENAVQTDTENQDFFTLRGQVLLTPTDNFEARLIADYSDRDEVCCSGVQFDYSPAIVPLINAVGGEVLAPGDPDERQAFSNLPFTQEITDWGLSGEVDWDLNIGTLTSVTAYRKWENSRGQDVDYSSADIAIRNPEQNFTNIERFSQELRLTGVNGNLDWLVGGFVSQEDLELGDAIRFGADWEVFLGLAASAGTSPSFVVDNVNALTGGAFGLTLGGGFPPPESGPIQDLYNQTASSIGLFTHNTYQVTEALSVTAGVRFTYEEKELDATFQTGPTPACGALETVYGFDPVTGVGQVAGAAAAGLAGLICLPYARTGLDVNGYDQERTDEEFSGTFKVSYRFTEDLLGYAGYSRGFKAGGFNLDRQFNGAFDETGFTNVDTSFEPEITDAFEIGFKTEWLDNALLLNANFFFQEISDFQLNSFTGTSFVVDSVPGITSQGVEADFLYFTPVEGLDLQGGFAYVDATYDDFVIPGNAGLNALAGETISLSPEFFLSGAANYERPIGTSLKGLFSLTGRWVSDYNTGSDLDPEKEQEAFALIGARVGIGSQDGLWAVELFGQNLLDETYAQVAFDAFAQGSRGGDGTRLGDRSTASYNAFLGAPRTYGVRLKTEF